MPKLIVHGDDLGLCEEINEGIKRAHTEGILTSTSIIANGSAFDHAISICRALPTLDVGVHLTLVEEKPVANVDRIQTLVNSDARFYRNAALFTMRYLTGRICLKQVERELEAQVKKVTDLGIRVTHLDSHQHLHMLPGVLSIVVALSQKYSIPAIRLPRESAVLGKIGIVPFSRIVQALVLNLFCRRAQDRIKRRTDSFAGFLFGGNMNKENLLKVLRNLHGGETFEIMCHPGLDDPNTRYRHWGYHWSDELDALTDKEIIEYVRQNGIQLTSYGELVNSCVQAFPSKEVSLT